MRNLIISILTQGAIAFIGSRVTKVVGQTEISQLISASGWAIIGINLLAVIVPIINSCNGFFDNLDSIADKFSWIGQLF